MRGQLRALQGGDRRSNDGARDTAGAAQRLLGRHKHVRDVLMDNNRISLHEFPRPLRGPSSSSPHPPMYEAGGTLSSHSRGRCSRISRGSVSAAMMISSAMPRFSVLVAGHHSQKNNNNDKPKKGPLCVSIRWFMHDEAHTHYPPSFAPFFSCL